MRYALIYVAMLPSHGLCHAVFLLVRVAHFRAPQTVEDWIKAARNQSTVMASALNLNYAAAALLRLGLATAEGGVAVLPPLATLWQWADRQTLRRIAAVLLTKVRPAWLPTAVLDGLVHREYIPRTAMEELLWLGDELDLLISDAARQYVGETENNFRRTLGIAGELIVMESEARLGHSPLHISKISDSFGYDIECAYGGSLARIEVKTATESTCSSFYLTRNEFEQAIRHESEWVLVQIILSGAVALHNRIRVSDISKARLISSRLLQTVIPADTPEFQWVDSARVAPSERIWCTYHLDLTNDFQINLAELDSFPT